MSEPATAQERAEIEEEVQATDAATRSALDRALREEDLDREDILDKLRRPDVDGSVVEDLEEQLGPELSGVYAIANWTREDYQRARWLNENKAERVLAEQNPGRLCTGPFLELAQGTHRRPDKFANRPRTPDEERAVREALGSVKTAMQSLAKGGEGLSAVADITAVTEHRQRRDDDDDSGGGRVRNAFGRVFS